MIVVCSDWVTLKNISNGSLFENKDGSKGVKTKYYNGKRCLCISLDGGGYIYLEEYSEVRSLQIGYEIK